MAAKLSNNAKMGIAATCLAVVAVGAYSIGRVFPPIGESAGTIAPAERYRSSQVGAEDITLGDNSVPLLMQTDTFELMVHDPNFRVLARDPNFAALAQHPQALVAMGQAPQAFAALAANPRAFQSLILQITKAPRLCVVTWNNYPAMLVRSCSERWA